MVVQDVYISVHSPLCSKGALLPNSSKETTKQLDFVHVSYYCFVQARIEVLPQESKAERVLCSPLSHVQLFATPWTVALQAPLSMGFSRQEYWSGLPFLSPGDLSDTGVEPRSPAIEGRFFTIRATRGAHICLRLIHFLKQFAEFVRA